ncbi:MAG: DUF1289 domain-containing protein [Spirochaetaceae bacterium]|nr:DUF1289 domain-containing protein [Spirochaetaceae bacterium]
MQSGRPLSPCKHQCELSQDRSHCIACKRSVEEIVGWISLSDSERMEIMEQLPLRDWPDS